MPQLQLDIPTEARKGKYKCRIEYTDTIHSITFSPYQQKQRKSVALAFDNNICYKYKCVDRRNLARLVQQAQTDDVIIVRNGMITDASYCNLVFEDYAGHLFTPSDALLPGTCRQRLIDNGIATERPICVNELHHYKNVYFINAMMDLEEAQKLPITAIHNSFISKFSF